jgi:hypothetical protein
MLRATFAVIAGYLLFATASIALFGISGRDPYGAAPLWFVAAATVYGMIAATAAGYMAAALAKRSDRRVPLALTIIIALGALASLSAGTPGQHWSQWAAIALMAPSAFLGGTAWRSRYARRSGTVSASGKHSVRSGV